MLLFWSTLWAGECFCGPAPRRMFGPTNTNGGKGKFSLLVFFRQMVKGLPTYMYIWWAVFTLVLMTYLGCILSNFLTCVPLQKYWSAGELFQAV
jgi:hypothetical protein